MKESNPDLEFCGINGYATHPMKALRTQIRALLQCIQPVQFSVDTGNLYLHAKGFHGIGAW